MNIFQEAVQVMMPAQLRNFFALFILAENYQATIIWNKFKNHFVEDFIEDSENQALLHINNILQTENYSCTDFALPEPNCNILKVSISQTDLKKYEKMYQKNYYKLNEQQKQVFDDIVTNRCKIVCVDGPGGSGKTFLYCTLIYYYLFQQKNIISMAWMGIASILLPGGMTSHRTFRLPIELDKFEVAVLELESERKKLRECNIIIWDEASMIPKKAFEIVDSTLRDLCQNNQPFAGKTVIVAGDFRQILPVLRNGHRQSIVEETIKFSHLWKYFSIYKLSENLRSINSTFSSQLLDVGEGRIDKFVIPQTSKTDDVCEKVFGNIMFENCSNSVILASHNQDVRKLNNKILKFLDNEEKIYYSIDYAAPKGCDQNDENILLKYPPEQLNKINEGLPCHELKLKQNAVVMLIRNLSINDGLCNGTRLKILNLYKYNIKAEIITGDEAGNIVFIPKITLNTGESSKLPFILYRKQFPIILAFVMSINKSQGQGFDTDGLYINRPLFSHGQLYVILSRGKNPKKIFIQNCSENENEIINIIWKEVFD